MLSKKPQDAVNGFITIEPFTGGPATHDPPASLQSLQNLSLGRSTAQSPRGRRDGLGISMEMNVFTSIMGRSCFCFIIAARRKKAPGLLRSNLPLLARPRRGEAKRHQLMVDAFLDIFRS